MNGPLKCHGGKHYLAGQIVGLMPPHLHYVEPYFGGGAVLFAKTSEGTSEVANDLNGNLMNFWRVLQDKKSLPSSSVGSRPHRSARSNGVMPGNSWIS